MTLLIINGNIPCCDCKRDTGIRSDARNLFNENEVYCYSCSSAMLSEVEDEEPPTLRMTSPYPFPIMTHTPGRSGIGFSHYIGQAVTPLVIVEAPDSGVRKTSYSKVGTEIAQPLDALPCFPDDCVCGQCED